MIPGLRVIVAGAGPVGLVAALSLADRGVPVTLLERRPELSAASRASTIHPPTLDILDSLGALAPVAHRGRIARTIQYRTPDAPFAEFDLAVLAGETRHPYRLHLEQAHITPILLQRLRRHPHATIRFDAEVTGLEQSDTGITAHTAQGPGLRQTFHGTWLLAADGARSRIRDALGIGFPGADYPHRVLRVMTTDDPEALLPGLSPVTYVHNGARSLSLLHMPECWRLILRVPAEVSDDQALEEAWILARLQEVLPTCTRLPTVLHKDVYGASRRVADRTQHGRAILLGDAAHVTNTRGGMNMNCGIHDAHALAAAIATNDPAAITATATARARVARDQLIPRTDRAVSGGATWAQELATIAQDPDAARAYLRTAAMLDMLTALPSPLPSREGPGDGGDQHEPPRERARQQEPATP